MSASTMTSAVSVSVLGVEVSPRATLAYSPHGGEKGPGGKACVKAAPCAPRSGCRALTRAAPRPCSSTVGIC